MVFKVINKHYIFNENTAQHLDLKAACTVLNSLEKSRDKWESISRDFAFYCACYEKAIEKLYDKYDSPAWHDERAIELLDELNSLYAELEKEDGSKWLKKILLT